MRKAGKELTKTRGVDPKRVSADDNAGKLLVSKAVEAMSREYDPKLPPAIYLPIRDLVTIGQALMACENNRDMWKAGLAGRWAPPIDSEQALLRAINLEKLGTKRRWIPGREDDCKPGGGLMEVYGSPIVVCHLSRQYRLKTPNRSERCQVCTNPIG
jgi:hypothetical protein